ncbi:MAG: hypothetical protein M3P94_06920 [Chloroflexota bacterium]|nr:hypothetical protein [Chloroflexota bacterium]
MPNAEEIRRALRNGTLQEVSGLDNFTFAEHVAANPDPIQEAAVAESNKMVEAEDEKTYKAALDNAKAAGRTSTKQGAANTTGA